MARRSRRAVKAHSWSSFTYFQSQEGGCAFAKGKRVVFRSSTSSKPKWTLHKCKKGNGQQGDVYLAFVWREQHKDHKVLIVEGNSVKLESRDVNESLNKMECLFKLSQTGESTGNLKSCAKDLYLAIEKQELILCNERQKAEVFNLKSDV